MSNPKYLRGGYSFAVGRLVEELGELQAALGKTLRWGPESYNPELPEGDREANEDWVRREIEDVRSAIENYLVEDFVRRYPNGQSCMTTTTPMSKGDAG